MRRTLKLTTAVWIVLLSAVVLVAGQNTPPSGDSDKSLGDIARKVRPKDAKVTTKRVFTDDDVAHGTAGPMPKPTDIQSPMSVGDAQAVIDRATNLNSRELGESIVKDVKFPTRDSWEADLYRHRLSLIGAAQTAVDYYAAKGLAQAKPGEKEAEKKVLASLMDRLSVERIGYDRVVAEGIGQAASWERSHR